MSVTTLHHAAQQHATALQAHMPQLLKIPVQTTPAHGNIVSDPIQHQLAQRELASLAQTNAALARLLATWDQQPAEETEEIQEACNKREQLLDNLLQQLDSSTQLLRSQLDSCHKLLASPPCMEEPETIIRYAHTLRFGFLPLGALSTLFSVAPNPVVQQMMGSALMCFNQERAKQKRQPQPVVPVQQPQQTAQQQQAEAQAVLQEGTAAQQQRPAAPAFVPIQFALNADLEDEGGYDDGMESASEDYSEEDDSED